MVQLGAQGGWCHHCTSVYLNLMPFCNCLQVIPEDLCCSAYAFDRGIFGLLGAVAAPLVNPQTNASQSNSVVSSVHTLLFIEGCIKSTLHSLELLNSTAKAGSSFNNTIEEQTILLKAISCLRRAFWPNESGVGMISDEERLRTQHLLRHRGE